MKCSRSKGVVVGGKQGDHGLPQFVRNRWIFGNFDVLLENFRNFVGGKDNGFEICHKVIELGLPRTLQVPVVNFMLL